MTASRVCSTDCSTNRYIRGDEKNPDKSIVIAPGVPKLLAFKELKIEPITLPPEAWQPGLRPWVAEAHLAAARKIVESAETNLLKAKEKLASAKKSEADMVANAKPATPKHTAEQESKLRDEDFAKLDKQRWQLFAGEWVHEPGQLEQKKDGATRSVLRLIAKPPQDFDATVRFRIVGGSKWRSIGLSFDTNQDDPTQPAGSDDSEQNVYVSAVAGGSKVQAAYHQGGNWQYPDARRSLPIELGRDYSLRVQVRGTLINASLDGEPVIAWRTPLERRDGAMQLTTFDALAVFHGISIAPLGTEVTLNEPAAKGKPRSPETARAAVISAQNETTLAECDLSVARAELESVQLRADAMRATLSKGGEKDGRDKTAKAILGERKVILAKARRRLTEAEQRLAHTTADKKEAIEKEVKSAREAMKTAENNLAANIADDDSFTYFIGAKWTPTRFVNSGKDDPIVKFAPQSTGRRTALANWITDRRNPLTARVAANHIWTRHMGQPLVPTVFDFGRNGTPPTHPQLLDWLAVELMENGWSMRHLHRVIVTSNAYRMSSSVAGREATAAKDPDNQYWWRRVPIRLESQAVRDSILALAGTLDSKMGGPPVLPAQQAASTRRGLYFFHSNNDRNLFLTTFDEALVKECYRREQSIVPQQALALTNSKLVLDASEQIAKRLSEAAAEDTDFIREAFAVVLGIKASDAEITTSKKALAVWQKLPKSSAESARSNFVWALINHNDFVTIR